MFITIQVSNSYSPNYLIIKKKCLIIWSSIIKLPKKNPYLSLNIKTYKAAKIKTVSFFFVKQELSLTN